MRRRVANPAGTEQRNPRTRGLDRKSTPAILRLLNDEDARVAAVVRRAIPQIASAADAVVKSLRAGGRLFYVGAGTSGRLAALEAAECPPTFGTPPGMVRAIVAGGSRALRYAAEAAEDSAAAGAREIARAGVARGDVVVAVSASGSTPYVVGALKAARRRGAVAVGITSNGTSPVARHSKIAILLETGPEAVAGSTRLKAGTAQKLALNMLSTAAMARLGRIYDNWMIYVALTNRKLRLRGARILKEATGVSLSAAEHTLRLARHNLPVALVMLKSGVTAGEARRWVHDSGGSVREALDASRQFAGAFERRGR